MNELKGACLLAQSGGPTSVINASLYGAVKAALADGRISWEPGSWGPHTG